jgi:hypothetical protein
LSSFRDDYDIQGCLSLETEIIAVNEHSANLLRVEDPKKDLAGSWYLTKPTTGDEAVAPPAEGRALHPGGSPASATVQNANPTLGAILQAFRYYPTLFPLIST